MKSFQVSVIVPVFNAEHFVVQAVESAVVLEEVGEVILVEDGSPDNALERCRELTLKYNNVKLYRHPDGQSKGPGASRNLGIENSSFDFIAFLDADDWYLPNRFKMDREVFMDHPEAEGVYNATGFYYEESKHLDLAKLTTFRERVSPQKLAVSLLRGNKGNFTTNAITLKRNLIDRAGGFSEKLQLHQDTHMWIRCAVHGAIFPSELEVPVAVRRVHKNNRIVHRNTDSHNLYYRFLYLSLREAKISDKELFNLAFRIHFGSKSNNRLIRYALGAWELLKRPGVILKLFKQ